MLDTGDRPEAGHSQDAQSRANDKLWARPDLVKAYATRVLRPVEVMLLVRYREELSGRVLELGCGAGRLTGYLGEIASSAHGLDISPAMVAYCRRTYPRATFDEGDLRDVAALERRSFDVIVASYNVIDVLSDAERGLVLDGIHGAIRPGGLLIMSSHNRASARRRQLRDALAARSPVGLAASMFELPRWLINRRRLVPFERNESGYAILNDISQDFSALHYYITRDAQARQFADHGFELLECLDLDGRHVEAGQAARHCPELHYVARASSRAGTAA
jgi:SAM-dependent methyltransferase